MLGCVKRIIAHHMDDLSVAVLRSAAFGRATEKELLMDSMQDPTRWPILLAAVIVLFIRGHQVRLLIADWWHSRDLIWLLFAPLPAACGCLIVVSALMQDPFHQAVLWLWALILCLPIRAIIWYMGRQEEWQDSYYRLHARLQLAQVAVQEGGQQRRTAGGVETRRGPGRPIGGLLTPDQIRETYLKLREAHGRHPSQREVADSLYSSESTVRRTMRRHHISWPPS